jgi:hypothetical protein
MANKPPLKIDLRALVYREGDVWLAHCLEMDIVAEGKTCEAASSDLVDLCDLQIKVALEEGDLQSVFRPAPSEYWKMFFMSAGTPQSALSEAVAKKVKGITSQGGQVHVEPILVADRTN